MATEDVRPRRDLAWVRSESVVPALAILVIGLVGLLLVTVGVTIVLVANGLTPPDNLIRGFKSNEMTGLGIGGVVLGIIAMAGGWGTFSRMPTKVSREEAVGGAVLGAQAAVLGALLLWFSEGDVEIFVINFLDFRVIGPQIDGFLTGIKNTVYMAAGGEFFGILLGLLLAVFDLEEVGRSGSG